MNIIAWFRDKWTNIQAPVDQDALEAEMQAHTRLWRLNADADRLRMKIAVAKKQKKATKPLQQELERTVQQILRGEQ